MAWYYGTYSCGHEGRVNIIGPVKDRQWKADREFSKMCPECYKQYLKKQREKEILEAKKKAEEMELPELTGTEKQVAWAITLRDQLINKFNKAMNDEDYMEIISFDVRNITKEDMIKIRDYIIENKTNAEFYIDARYWKLDEFIIKYKKDALKPKEEVEMEKKLLEEIEKEAIIVPENAITNSIARIVYENNEIVVTFEKNDKFIEIVKKLGYKWINGAWRKEITNTTGTATERIAELGNKLLAAGFPVKIYDHIAREKAINADYEPERNKWIYLRTSGKYEGWLVIKWQGRNDSLYQIARKLSGSKWDNGVVVKVEYFEEVEEFARLYDFKFTDATLKAIQEYKEAYQNSVTTVEKPKETESRDGLKEILESSTEILDDLKDD